MNTDHILLVIAGAMLGFVLFSWGFLLGAAMEKLANKDKKKEGEGE
jgi:hypothetical protein